MEVQGIEPCDGSVASTPPPRGRQLVTLKDAGTYITKLPRPTRDADEWWTGLEALLERDDDLGKMVQRIRKKYPSRTKPIKSDLEDFTFP
jgi:hypothetical protein